MSLSSMNTFIRNDPWTLAQKLQLKLFGLEALRTYIFIRKNQSIETSE